MARSKRQPTPGDMVRSLAIVLLPILVITFIASRNLDDHPVQVVDWRPVLATARTQAPYPVLAPVNPPSTWRPTRVSWLPVGQPDQGGKASIRNEWQLGFLNPEDIYVAIVQGDVGQPDLLAQKTRSGLADGQSTVGKQVWQRRVSADDRTRALVLTSPEVANIVVGDTSYAVLEAFAGTLQSD